MEPQVKPVVYDKLVGFEDTPDGLAIRHTQEVPDDIVEDLKRDKIKTDGSRIGDFFRVFSIPVITIEKWDREGFRWEEELKNGSKGLERIRQKLLSEHLDAAITTNKSL